MLTGVVDDSKEIRENIDLILKVYLERKENIIPHKGGGYGSLDNTLFCNGSNEVRNFWEKTNLSELFNGEAMKIDDGIMFTKLYSIIKICRNYNSSNTFDMQKMINKLTPEFLQKQTDEWLIQLFELVAPKSKTPWNNQSFFAAQTQYEINNVPLIRLEDNAHVCLHDKSIYLNNGTIKNTILKNKTGYNFYKDILQIPEITPADLIRKEVLQKYSEGLGSYNISQEDNIADLKRIKNYCEQHTLADLELSNYNILRCRNTVDENIYWGKPQQIFLSKTYTGDESLEILLDGIVEIYFLDDSYDEILNTSRGNLSKQIGQKPIDTWIRFFENIGVMNNLPVTKITEYTPYWKNNFYWRAGINAKCKKFMVDFSVPNLSAVIAKNYSLKKSLEIYRIAKKYIDQIADYMDYCETRQTGAISAEA